MNVIFDFIGIEFFSNYVFFSNGLIGLGFQMILWIILFYSIYRSEFDKPFEKTIEILLPAILASFILAFINIGLMINGLITITVLLLSVKHYTKLKWHKFATFCFQLVTLLWLFSNAREFGLILFLLYALYNFVDSQQKISERKKIIKN